MPTKGKQLRPFHSAITHHRYIRRARTYINKNCTDIPIFITHTSRQRIGLRRNRQQLPINLRRNRLQRSIMHQRRKSIKNTQSHFFPLKSNRIIHFIPINPHIHYRRINQFYIYLAVSRLISQLRPHIFKRLPLHLVHNIFQLRQINLRIGITSHVRSSTRSSFYQFTSDPQYHFARTYSRHILRFPDRRMTIHNH